MNFNKERLDDDSKYADGWNGCISYLNSLIHRTPETIANKNRISEIRRLKRFMSAKGFDLVFYLNKRIKQLRGMK